jgi:predicted nucleic-acid-binding Zn-ribbon protein
MKFEQTKTCSKCGFSESLLIDKKLAAFEKTRVWESHCVKCNNTSFKSSSVAIPPPDFELLKIWSESKELMFLSQDEDILLSEPENYDLLIKFVRNESIPSNKREILLSAICVILFDNTPEDESDTDEYDINLADKVRSFLINNKSLFDDLDKFYIGDYIKKVVYPQIGIK